MYYLTEEEQKRLIKKIIPQGRSMEVQEELRGWSWNKDPLDPPTT
jgi:CRISPR-associated protein Csa1